MSAAPFVTFRRALAAAFVVATAACADNLIAPTTSGPLSANSLALDAKTTLPIQARGLRDKNGLTLFEVSTGDPNVPSIAPGQLTHVHFKLCKNWQKDGFTTKQFSANFHFQNKLYADREKDDEIDSPDDPAYRSDPNNVNWDRSASRTTIRSGGYSTFAFSGLPEGIPVEVKVTYKVLKAGSKKSSDFDSNDYDTRNITLCVPVQRAPDPTLKAGGMLGLSGPDFAFAGTPVTYNIFVFDPVGTANTTGTCNLYVTAPGATTPTLIGTGTVTVTQDGGGVCTFSYTFPTGGAYVVSATIGGILPIDYDITDNAAAITVNVSGPTGGGTGGDSGPEAVVASFSALGTVQTVSTPYGPTTITAYSDVNTKTVADPAYAIGDDQPSQGVNIKVTLLKLLVGPFSVEAHLDTQGQSLGHILLDGLVLSPANTRKGPGNTPLSPGDLCSQVVVVDNPEGYQAQVCVNTISNSTVFYFNAHANFDANSGHFVPYGTTLSFDTDVISEGKHYRIPTQTFSLESSSGIMPACSRYTSGPILVSCLFNEPTTIRAGSDAQRSNIIIYGSDQ